MMNRYPELPKNAERIYHNPLRCPQDVSNFILEGNASISFPQNRMRMENRISETEGQKANYVFWCPQLFPSDLYVTWEFRPVREPGLAMIFFAANGNGGHDLFDPALAVRAGEYPSYHNGDIHAFHASYFRRKEPDERAFHTCNLRKSPGLQLVAQGGDPLPDVRDAVPPYRIGVSKKNDTIRFYVDDLCVYTFVDDGLSWGSFLAGGYIGFRQLAPLSAEYAELEVFAL